MKLRKNDQVKVVVGKDAGKTGKVEKVFKKKGLILITGVNQYKRHMKARSQNQPSEIITLTKPLAIGNVMLVCPNCHKLTRIGFKDDGKAKIRICKKCQEKI